MSESNKSTTSFKLKIIAIISMFIDHIGAAVVEKVIDDPLAFGAGDDLVKVLKIVDDVLRSVGRLAFPLFIFMIIEAGEYNKHRRVCLRCMQQYEKYQLPWRTAEYQK